MRQGFITVWAYTWRMALLGFAAGGILGGLYGRLVMAFSNSTLLPAGCLGGLTIGCFISLPLGLIIGAILGFAAYSGRPRRLALQLLGAVITCLGTLIGAAAPYLASV